jgi:hypothetical protein
MMSPPGSVRNTGKYVFGEIRDRENAGGLLIGDLINLGA